MIFKDCSSQWRKAMTTVITAITLCSITIKAILMKSFTSANWAVLYINIIDEFYFVIGCTKMSGIIP